MWKLGLPASRESWQSRVHPGLEVKLTELLRLSVSTFLPGLLLRKPRALRDKA